MNDLGGDQQGGGADATPAQQTVDDIRAMGGEAVVNGENVADWDGATRLVEQAVDTFGDLHVLVNNAGILRDRVIVNMTEDEWDSVVARAPQGSLRARALRGQLLARADQGGTRDQRRDREHDLDVGAVLEPGAGQLRRGEVGDRHALAGVRQGARALRRAGERDRARRRGRASRCRPRVGDAMASPTDGSFDQWSPANVSPFVAYLSHGRLPVHRRDVPRARRCRAASADVDCSPRRSNRTTVGRWPSWRGGRRARLAAPTRGGCSRAAAVPAGLSELERERLDRDELRRESVTRRERVVWCGEARRAPHGRKVGGFRCGDPRAERRTGRARAGPRAGTAVPSVGLAPSRPSAG